MTTAGIHRRQALTGAAGLALGLPVLAACGSDEPTASASGSALGSTSDIAVGGGAIFDDQQVVVTQPTEGDFKAFTAICPHQKCLVGKVEDGTIQCPCHGSQFSIEDGRNVQGPSGSPAGTVDDLAEVGITVEGGRISLA